MSLRIHLPDPGRTGADVSEPFPLARSGNFITVENTYDFTVRLTIHSTDRPRPILIPPGECAPIHGRQLARVQIEALPRPRKGLMRFHRPKGA